MGGYQCSVYNFCLMDREDFPLLTSCWHASFSNVNERICLYYLLREQVNPLFAENTCIMEIAATTQNFETLHRKNIPKPDTFRHNILVINLVHLFTVQIFFKAEDSAL